MRKQRNQKSLCTPLQEVHDKAVELGLFNREWYENHCGEFETSIEAFEDYFYKSPFSNVNPSPNLDNEGYLRENLDAYHGGESPVHHFIMHGMEENRKVRPAHLRWIPKNELVPEESEDWAEQRVAVCLHIFYADFVEKFALCLSQFPMPVDVYVAASSEEVATDAEQVFSEIEQVNKVDVRITPNRGRNFGPMLVEFSDDLLEYDLLLHLHSKKSLYSGREQTQWFDYLNQYLFKDKHVVSCILRLFEQNQEMGMYYPTSFWMMPSWVNHWTCNKGFAKGFVDEWDIDIDSNFVNYPVGGMFWARPKAIKQLLEKEYVYEDFPEEPLPNDGSWLHALERSVGLLVEKNGFEQFYYYPPAARFTTDGSYKFSNYSKPPEQLFRELRNFHVVSFDVFDTLLRREHTAADFAKYKLGKVLTEMDVIDSPEAFVKLRNATEHQIRVERNFVGDVTIEDVYQRIGKSLCCDPEQTRSFMEMEFQFDLDEMLAKDEIVAVVHQLADLGREIWFISDTYYQTHHIEAMLRKIGIAIPYRLFLSSETNCRKDTGTMWAMIKDELTELELSHIHVGDNVRADAQICGDYGLHNMHILHPLDKWRAAGYEVGNINPDTIDESEIRKWGRLVSNHGRYPFFGE